MADKIKQEFITSNDVKKLIDKYDPQYVLLISARNDGKSYAVKRTCLEDYWTRGEEFCYLRRYEIDLKRVDPAQYWDDFLHPVNVFEEITKGEYSGIRTGQNRAELRLTRKGEDGKIEESERIAHVHALSVARSYKSIQFPKVHNILYEEFVTDSAYLYDEPKKLMNYVSTIFRRRNGRVFLVGNTITRLNPYFREWQLTNFNKMVPGQVDIYDHKWTDENGTESNTRILLHIPDVTGKQGIKGMFFGSAANMIAGQKWDSNEQPHLMGRVREYNTIYQLVFYYDDNASFLMRLLQHRTQPDRVLWYVEPKTTGILDGTRLISPVRFFEKFGGLYTDRFRPISTPERKAFDILNNGRITYSDNLTGTEFQRALRMMRIRDQGE